MSAEDYTRACLDRIAAVEGEIQAFAHLDPEHALAQARALDERERQGMALGPLHGVPVAIKDIIDTSDYPDRMRLAVPVRPPALSRRALWSKRCATPAPSSSARPSPPNSPIFIRARPAIRTITERTPGGSSSGLRGGGRGRHGAAGARHADQRLGDPAGRVLRRVRREAEPRALYRVHGVLPLSRTLDHRRRRSRARWTILR